MSVGLSITLMTFKFLTLFVALVGRSDAGYTSIVLQASNIIKILSFEKKIN